MYIMLLVEKLTPRNYPHIELKHETSYSMTSLLQSEAHIYRSVEETSEVGTPLMDKLYPIVGHDILTADLSEHFFV